MKKNDKNLNLASLNAKELLQIKGGARKIPGGVLPMSRFSRWEEVDIRFQGNTNSKSIKPALERSFTKIK